MKTTLHILQPGAHTTVQDLGRPGRRSAGIASGGAVDPVSLRIANLLVGNNENAAALECALVGPTIRFSADVTIALCGGKSKSLSSATRLEIRARETVEIGALDTFAYAYLAIAGGIDVPVVMGSRSTDTRIGWGGVQGGRLGSGDKLLIDRDHRPAHRRPLRADASAFIAAHGPIRVLPGKDAKRADPSWLQKSYRVSSRSDRMGLRLDGAPISREAAGPDESAIVLPGTVQLPSDGQPIVLLADAQTLGGYPQIAHVIGVDLPRIAQRSPGSIVEFEVVTLSEAHRLAFERERHLAFLRFGLASGE